uniref:Tail protein n=1 Tax=Siphoviridae sp. ctiJm4 TaxID=2827916 RepID=A0A8S5T1J6_9CAUD|nr:MAG TPA: tail protein [Siphoviridae sp. ctiJm4]
MGGKKKGGSSHTPVEAKETGRSFQILRMLEVISEGEIEGLVDDMKSVYLDKTPLCNKDGSFNFKNVSVYANAGTQDQDVLKEFNSVEKEINVGSKVLKDKPIIKTVTDANVNRVRMTLGVDRLLKQEDNGDTNPTSVTMSVEILKDNSIVGSYTHTFSGKYSNTYREMFDITVPKAPFSIRVSRVEPDSLTNKVQNTCFWASYTEIIDKEFAYPNTALVGIKIDSEYFGNIPTRNYEINGLIIKVPSNYNPETHTYTSDFWNGSFKLAWTNNPAWVFYDLVTNTRYGMGKRLQEFNIDKWQLYAIGRYCDELVPDGFGGQEPRMTCNIWITDQRKAYDLINDICSIFRAMPVWNGQALTAIQDRKADPVWTYNNANTIGGFTRQRSARKARHNTIQVEYIDASDFYEKKVESVSDDVAVARFGENVKKITAFGCTSRGQAYRTGRWLLETEKLETETITFTVGQEGVMHLPYDVIEVADSQYAGINVGGRVLAVNGTQLTLDRPIEIDDNSYLSYVSGKGITENVKIVSFDKQNNIATVAKNLNGIPELTVWGLSTKRITTGLYRAISIKENDNAEGKTYTITALQHVPEKEEIVINGTHFDPKPQTIYGDVIDAEINYNGSRLTVNGKVNGSFNVLSSNSIASYTVKLLRDGSLVYIEKGLATPDIKVDDLENGIYEAQILAYNDKNQLLNQYTKTFTIDRPPIVTGIEVVGNLSSIILTWNFVDDTTQTEIWCSETDDINTAQLVERITGAYYSHEVGAKKVRYYWLRNKRGVNVGKFDQVQGRKGESGVDINAELEVLNKELSKNIVNDIIDVALPARKLGMTLYVNNLDVNVYQGQKQVYDETSNKSYTWNGTKYIPVETELLASKIKGIIQPSQLAPIPTANLAGKLTDAQIEQISATKLIGNISLAQIPSIPTNKLTGLLTDAQVQNISATKITGTLDISKVPAIPTTKLSGTIGANQITANSIGTNHLGANAVTAEKILSGAITSEKITSNAITADKIVSNAITTDKLSANAITAQKIAGNAIESNHIKAGSIIAGKLGANAVTADNIATNAITATKIMGGAITAEKLSANSVGANAIQAGAITTDKLGANSVDAGKIRAGAINANHLQAGQISADKLAIGLGGNLLYNPIFANNGYGWGIGAKNSSANLNIEYRNSSTGNDFHAKDTLPNENVLVMKTNATQGSNFGWGDPCNVIMKINAGQWYIFSIYANAYGFSEAKILVEKYSADGQSYQGIVAQNTQPYKSGSASKNIAGMSRYFVKFQAPDTGCVSLRFRCSGTVQKNNPDCYIARSMLEECTQYATEPSAWQNAGVTSIHGGSIVTNSITADKIGANQITANHIVGGAISGDHIAGNTITGNKIKANTIGADKISVSTLSALSANLGSITGGAITIGSMNGNYGTLFEVNAQGGFRLIARDSLGGIEISSATRALTVWDGVNEVIKLGKL